MDAAAQSPNGPPLLLDAQITDGHLKVTSTAFDRMEIALAHIPALAHQPPASIASFEIDQEGAYLYWPDAEVHLGWSNWSRSPTPLTPSKPNKKAPPSISATELPSVPSAKPLESISKLCQDSAADNSPASNQVNAA